MKLKVILACPLLITALFAASASKAARAQGQPNTRPRLTQQQIDRWMKEANNWGRWGKGDQLGTINLITDNKRRQAIALAKTATVVSLAHKPELVAKSKSDGAGAHLEIKLNMLDAGFTTEDQEIAFHGSTFTHIDGLCHGDYDGKIYNGLSLKEMVSSAGCKKMGIDNLAGGLVTRGILVDIPRLRGVAALPPGTQVFTEDIEAWEKMAGIKISAGDAVFLHTGRWGGSAGQTSGFDVSVGAFLKARDVALIGTDGILDAGEVPGTTLPLHKYVLVALGMNIIDNAELTALAETAARLKRWEFMLVAGPIATPGGTGSPLNPLAIF
jgi:kynurenine formamidase